MTEVPTRQRPSPRPRSRPEDEEESTPDDHVQEAEESPESTSDDQADDSPDSAETPEKPRKPRNWRLRAAVGGLTVLTLAAIGAGVLFFLRTRADDEQDRLRAEAVQVAGQQAVNLLTVNGQNVDAQLAALTAGATGDFQRQFEGIAKTFGDVVRQGKVDSTGRVEAAGVDQLTADTARVQLALSSSVSNAQAAGPQTRQYRITVDLDRKDNRWLVSGMQFVP
ncbi:hypothetical protein [Amycolatopsis sp.]|uniref:hypothetical protein n=1 Tax=Amycolatopsis sp. TaxID=37632 RepID=UPI002C239A45|nr:hypothetical protein [Amycolatopsis sp.]HVV12664.1 hypothetical protein [Amycolatopsis sp.]